MMMYARKGKKNATTQKINRKLLRLRLMLPKKNLKHLKQTFVALAL